MILRSPTYTRTDTLFPSTTLCRSLTRLARGHHNDEGDIGCAVAEASGGQQVGIDVGRRSAIGDIDGLVWVVFTKHQGGGAHDRGGDRGSGQQPRRSAPPGWSLGDRPCADASEQSVVGGHVLGLAS